MIVNANMADASVSEKASIILSGRVGLLWEFVSRCYFMVLNGDMVNALISETVSVSNS